MMNQEIIEAFCRMDIEELNNLLGDDITYQMTTKKIFLKRLNERFDEFKEKDISLHPFTGKCCGYSGVCRKGNVGKEGVTFIGENSKKYISLIFQNNPDGSLKKLYSCGSFQVSAEQINRLLKDGRFKEINPFIHKDEEFDSLGIKGRNYLECHTANKELLRYKNKVFTKDFIIKWVEKHSELFLNIKIFDTNFKTQNLFYSMYNLLNQYYELLRLEKEAKVALKIFKKIDGNQELEILEWLKSNYELVCFIWNYETAVLKDADLFGQKKINYEFNFFIDITPLKNCIEFESIYSKYSYLKEKHKVNDGNIFVEVLGKVINRSPKIIENQKIQF